MTSRFFNVGNAGRLVQQSDQSDTAAAAFIPFNADSCTGSAADEHADDRLAGACVIFGWSARNATPNIRSVTSMSGQRCVHSWRYGHRLHHACEMRRRSSLYEDPARRGVARGGRVQCIAGNRRAGVPPERTLGRHLLNDSIATAASLTRRYSPRRCAELFNVFSPTWLLILMRAIAVTGGAD
jgi:hypothetical protein